MTKYPNYLGGVKATLCFLAIIIFGLTMVPLAWWGSPEIKAQAIDLIWKVTAGTVIVYCAGKLQVVNK